MSDKQGIEDEIKKRMKGIRMITSGRVKMIMRM